MITTGSCSKKEGRVTLKVCGNGNAKIMMRGSGEAKVDWGDGIGKEKKMIGKTNEMFSHFYSGKHKTPFNIVKINTTYHDINIYADDITYLNCSNLQLNYVDVTQVAELRGLECVSNNLKYVNVRHNPELILLNCGGNAIKEIDVSKNANLSDLLVNYNDFSSEDLNKLFGLLPDNVIPGISRNIYVGGCPGARSCDRSIAESRGWTVHDNYNIGN
jgi:hypothetical protein